MIEAHEIIKQVQEKYKGLPDKMANLETIIAELLKKDVEK